MAGIIDYDENGKAVVPSAVRWDTNSAAPIYLGTNSSPDATEGRADWTIWKFVYSGSDKTKAEKRVGSWTNRSSLGWLI